MCWSESIKNFISKTLVLKKIYLDWADLQNFLEGKFSQELNDLIESNYLVISPQHFVELFAGKDQNKVRSRLKRLNTIKNRLYIRISNGLDVYEPLKWISDHVVSMDLDTIFFQKTYFMSISSDTKVRYKPDDLLQFYEEYLNDPTMPETFEHWRKQSLYQATVLANDRRLVDRLGKQNSHEAMIATKLKEKMFLTFGEALFGTLLLTDQYPTSFKINPLTRQVLVNGSPLNESAMKEIMPYLSLFNEATLAKGHKFAGQQLGSNSFQKNASDLGDAIHFSAMPLVDVFTCDTTFYQRLTTCPNFSKYAHKVFAQSNPEFESKIVAILRAEP